MTKYVIIGSGIIGLYTAYNLLESGVDGKEVTLIAEFLPGDESVRYTSPYAGGNFSCITGNDKETLEFDKFTYKNLGTLQRKLGGPKCGLKLTPSTEIWDQKPPQVKIDSLKSYLKDYRVVEKSKLPEGAEFSIKFTTWNFNCPKFLFNFQQYLTSRGVTFQRKKLGHISEAFLPHTKAVFNCTGNGAATLGGVQDTNVYPTRGQVVVVKAPHIHENVLRWGKDYATYAIKRPHSHDQLILGGFLQKNWGTPDTFKEQSEDILARMAKMFPKVFEENPHGSRPEDLEVLRVAAGLRPSRHGGVRIEKEVLDERKVVIHNYGASGYGYQAGLGMGRKAVDLLFAAKL